MRSSVSQPLSSGMRMSSTTRSGRVSEEAAQAAPPVLSGDDLVAVALQDDPQREREIGSVVDDEDPVGHARVFDR